MAVSLDSTSSMMMTHPPMLNLTMTNDSAGALTGADATIPDVFYEHPVLTSTILFFLTIFTTLGTFGNVLVIGAVCVYKPLRKPGNVFVVNLALADVGISILVDPMAIIGLVDGYRFYGINHPDLCVAVATGCLWFCICSILNIMVISINRYIALCKSHLYAKIFTWGNCYMMAVLVWILSIAIEIPNHMGWGSNAYDGKAMICLYDRTHTYSYTVFFAIVAIILPILVVFICYLKIFLQIHKSKQALNKIEAASNTVTTGSLG